MSSRHVIFFVWTNDSIYFYTTCVTIYYCLVIITLISCTKYRIELGFTLNEKRKTKYYINFN